MRTMKRPWFYCLCPLFFLTTLLAQSASDSIVAPTPPMGWNSWDSYGTTVREAQVKANADWMADHLAKYGWKYIVVDIQWYEPNAQGHDYRPGAPLTMDDYGRLIPALNRFPSSANGAGFKPLADYVHRKGLKFGIHIMRGIPRQAVEKDLPIKGTSYHAADIADKENACRWNPDMWGVDTTKPGSQAYYDSIAQLYASWGVDFIKADDMGSHLYQPAEMKALSQAMRKTGRPMVLSISPGPGAAFLRPSSSRSTRRCGASPTIFGTTGNFCGSSSITRATGRGSWARTTHGPMQTCFLSASCALRASRAAAHQRKFTPDEQQTVMTLWSIFRSPLIFGGDLPSNDAATTALITNQEVLDMDQHSSGGHQALEKGNIRSLDCEWRQAGRTLPSGIQLWEKNSKRTDVALSEHRDLRLSGRSA